MLCRPLTQAILWPYVPDQNVSSLRDHRDTLRLLFAEAISMTVRHIAQENPQLGI